ncbi:MAG: glycoside hydrolase family 3 N-terminal domain-containing protein, partial [Enterobacteriaceae bacterium]
MPIAQAKPLSADELKQLSATPQESARRWVQQMSLSEQVGQLMMLRLQSWPVGPQQQSETVTRLPDSLALLLSQHHIGGIILFNDNFQTIEQSYQLIASLQSAADPLPLLIAVDHEGGRVTRIPFVTEMPGNMALAATRDLRLARLAGEVHGQELSALGINMNMAPVVDVNSNQNNPVIDSRSYSSNPQLTGEMAGAYIDGLHKNALAACAKHFPGHGDTGLDSHINLPLLAIGLPEWQKRELIPFKAAIAHKVDAIMVAHILFPALDNRTKTLLTGAQIGIPSSLSARIMTSMLRDTIGFQGLIITDALDMGAIRNYFGQEEAIEAALLAGADIPLMPVNI